MLSNIWQLQCWSLWPRGGPPNKSWLGPGSKAPKWPLSWHCSANLTVWFDSGEESRLFPRCESGCFSLELACVPFGSIFNLCCPTGSYNDIIFLLKYVTVVWIYPCLKMRVNSDIRFFPWNFVVKFNLRQVGTSSSEAKFVIKGNHAFISKTGGRFPMTP